MLSRPLGGGAPSGAHERRQAAVEQRTGLYRSLIATPIRVAKLVLQFNSDFRLVTTVRLARLPCGWKKTGNRPMMFVASFDAVTRWFTSTRQYIQLNGFNLRKIIKLKTGSRRSSGCSCACHRAIRIFRSAHCILTAAVVRSTQVVLFTFSLLSWNAARSVRHRRHLAAFTAGSKTEVVV